MTEILSCLVEEHAFGRVAVAGLICLCAATISFGLAERGRLAAGPARWAWSGVAGLVAGSGIWATHFVAMLAWSPGLPVAFQPGRTILSIVIAVVGATLAFVAAGRPGPRERTLGGILLGLAVGAMHYTGMAALEVQAFTR